MGQYYYTINLDKKQFIHPHKFDDGLKLMEFGQSAGGTLLGLTILLADGNGRGGGDINCEEDTKDANLIGSWAGDRIVIAGDYADAGKFIENPTDEQLQKAANECYSEDYRQTERVDLHAFAQTHYEDISDKVVNLLKTCGEWQRN